MAAAEPETLSDSSDLLCIILDLNPIAWSLSAKPATDDPTGDSLSLQQALNQIIIFCNAHLSLRHENQIAVFAAGFGQSRQLFSSQLVPSTASTSGGRDSNTYQQFRIVDEKIADGVRDVLAAIDANDDDVTGQGVVGLVGALSMALCHINRLTSGSSMTPNLAKPRPRIAIMSVTDDASSQYVSIMNCIFTAQKNNIPIDVCKIYGKDAVFLQQACHLTSGSYFKISRRSGLLQYLLITFLPGPSARKHLTQPTQDQVDLRAACFCHRNIVDIGYVCSVCLSIFCSPLPVCSTCRTKFPMATLKRLGFGSKPARTANGATNGAPPKKKRKVVPSASVVAGTAAGPGSGSSTPTAAVTPQP